MVVKPNCNHIDRESVRVVTIFVTSRASDFTTVTAYDTAKVVAWESVTVKAHGAVEVERL